MDNENLEATLENPEDVLAEEPEPSETTEESEEETPEEEPVSREEFEQLKKQNAQLFARAKKAEERVSKPSAENKGDEEFRPRVEFLLSNRDINADEYDHLAAVAMRNSGKITLDSLTDAKKSETEYLSYLRKKVESKNKVPSSTSASALSRVSKTFEEVAKMTPHEHQKYEEQMLRAANTGI